MNKKELEKNVGSRGRLRPPAKDEHEHDVDDDWLIEKVTDTAVLLTHMPTSAPLLLGLDHIKERMSDPPREGQAERQFGFLLLNVEVRRTAAGAFVSEPIVPRLGRAVPPRPAQRPTRSPATHEASGAPRQPTREDVREMAARIKREKQREFERGAFLQSEAGVQVATAATTEIFQLLEQMKAEGEYAVTPGRSGVQIYRKGYSITVVWHQAAINTLRDSELMMTQWDGRTDFGEMRVAKLFHKPREIGHSAFRFDVTHDGRQVWRCEDAEFTNEGVAHEAVRRLLTLIEMDKGARDDWA